MFFIGFNVGAADTTSYGQNYYICMFLHCNLFYVI